MRSIEKKRVQWKVTDWHPMRFIERRIDPCYKGGIIDIFKNEIYTAIIRVRSDGVTHISFHNKENSTEIPWSHKQQIKNDICGLEREAIEIFPAMSRLVDAANQYHLWVYPEGYMIPTGFPTTKRK